MLMNMIIVDFILDLIDIFFSLFDIVNFYLS
jgi:hypothetical protein